MINEINKAQAIQSLRPKAQQVLRGDELEWLDETQAQPTEAKITAEIARLEIADQLDELYHNGIDGWKTTIKSVKDKYPRGGN